MAAGRSSGLLSFVQPLGFRFRVLHQDAALRVHIQARFRKNKINVAPLSAFLLVLNMAGNAVTHPGMRGLTETAQKCILLHCVPSDCVEHVVFPLRLPERRPTPVL